MKSNFNFRKMFYLDIFFTNQLDLTKAIIPLALMASESIAHSAFGFMATVDLEPIRAWGIIAK